MLEDVSETAAVADRFRALAEHQAEAEAKYRNLVEQLPCVVYLAEYGPDGDWLYVSPQLERILGYTPEAWLEHPHPQASFTHPDDLERVREAEARSFAESAPRQVEYRMRRADGSYAWLMEEATAVLGPDGRPLFLQGLMFDITERQESEERLRAVGRLKDTVLHTLSHDLRSPLTAILVAASTLERLGEDLDEETRAHLLRTLVQRSKGMNAILSDLLDLDRLDQGIIAPRRYPVDLAALIRGLLERTDLPEGRSVHFEHTECRANVDPPKVERIVDNLISNALRHTAVSCRVEVHCWREGDAAVIAVEDDGPGVPQELRQKVFEPFWRGSAESSAGSGIGLSLVARFAELHGGRAWVEPSEGGGASFRVLLPDADG